MRQAGKITAAARSIGREMVTPGVTTQEIDHEIYKFIKKSGAVPSFLGYGGISWQRMYFGERRSYPWHSQWAKSVKAI